MPPNPFAPPPYVRPARPPMSVRLAALPRMVVTLAVAMAAAWRVAGAIDRVATDLLPDAEPAPHLAAQITLAAMVAFLLGVWAWLDPVLVRARFGRLGRFAAGTLGCLLGTVWVATLPVLWVAFFALLDVGGARSALTVMLVTPLTPLLAWVPAFWLGELAGAVVDGVRRTRPTPRADAATTPT